MPQIRFQATQAAHDGHPIIPWSVEIQGLISEVLTNAVPELGVRLANSFACGTHLGWGYMRSLQGFQVEVVKTNIDDAFLHLRIIQSDGLALSYSIGISQLYRKCADAQAGQAKWQDVAALFEALRDDLIKQLPGP
jgi:hypothetical protein